MDYNIAIDALCWQVGVPLTRLRQFRNTEIFFH